MRRSTRLARKAESEGEAISLVELTTPKSTTGKARTKRETPSTAKTRKVRPKKTLELDCQAKEIKDFNVEEDLILSKELFSVQEIDANVKEASGENEEKPAFADDNLVTNEDVKEDNKVTSFSVDNGKLESDLPCTVDIITEEQEPEACIAEPSTDGLTTERSFEVISRECSDQKSDEVPSSVVDSQESKTVDIDDKKIEIHGRTSFNKEPKIHSKKPCKMYNFSFNDTKKEKNKLLKLTSDIFKSIPVSFSKEDLMGEKSNVTKSNKKNVDVHKLDVISLSVNKDDDDRQMRKTLLSSELDPKMDCKDLYFDVGKHGPVDLKTKKRGQKKEMPVMKKSVLGPDLEKKDGAPKVNEPLNQRKKKKKSKEGETAGPGWFNMPKTEMTDELKKDIQIMKMRNILDPKRFYKKADKKMPKYFQVGRVIEGATDFYSARIPKKERKRTMVDELLEDAEFRQRNKRKYLEIQSKKESGGKKYYKKMKNKRKETWARS
eukprot:gene14972-16515_t